MNQDLEPHKLKAAIREGLINGATESLIYPLKVFYCFNFTKSINPFIARNNIRMNSSLDYYAYFKKRDGTYRIWNCFWSGSLDTVLESVSESLKGYLLNDVLKFTDSSLVDPTTGELPKISAKKALRFLFVCFGVDIITAIIDNPFALLWVRMVSDYEPVPQYDHIVDCWCKTVEKDGFLGLFKSLGWSILGRFVESATNALLYYNNQPNALFEFSNDTLDRIGWVYYAVNFLSVAVSYPIDKLFFQGVFGKPKLRFGPGLYDGVWLELFPLCGIGFNHLLRNVRKEN